jgi:hypothetical protein
MSTESSVTETVVRNHLQAFLEQKGIAAILDDYHEYARFYSEAKTYQGKQEIHGFFMDFIASLPAGGIDHFSLRSQRVDGNIAFITWSVGSGYRYFCCEQRQDRFTNVCHVCRAGSIDLEGASTLPPSRC